MVKGFRLTILVVAIHRYSEKKAILKYFTKFTE